jgi:integrase
MPSTKCTTRPGRPKTGTWNRRPDRRVRIGVTLPTGERTFRIIEGSEKWDDQKAANRAGYYSENPEKLMLPEELEPSAPKGETLAKYVERWLSDRKARGRKVDKERSKLPANVLPDLGPRPIAGLTRRDLEQLVERLDKRVQGGEIAPKTAQNIWGLLGKLLDDATNGKTLALRVLTEDPSANVRGPDHGPRKARSYLYPEELSQLMACEQVPRAWRRAVALSVYLFTRRGELEALDWGDVDVERGIVHVHKAVDHETGEIKSTKTGETRRFAIEVALLPLLRAMHAESGGKGRVIPALPYESNFARELRSALGRAGVERPELFASDETRKPLTFHDLRATGLTWMAVRADDPLKIMQRAGHTDFRTTQLYIREAEALRAGFGEPFPSLPSCLLGGGISITSFDHGGHNSAEPKCRRRESNPRPGAYETPALAD